MSRRWALLFGLLSCCAAGGEPVVLRIASREMPTRLAPAGPLGDADRQAFDLIFEPLVAVTRGEHGVPVSRPVLAEAIPSGQGVHLTFRIRPGAEWSNGEPVTAVDVRHSLRHLQDDAGDPLARSKLVGAAQSGASPREVRISLRHGLIEPWGLFDFPIVPQLYKGRDLVPRTDPEFALGPIGSGPFVAVGPIQSAGAAGIAFRKNPKHPLSSRIPFDEVHWFAVRGPKDLASLKPDLTLGFAEAPSAKSAATRRVWCVAPNHRKTALADPDLRRFLALSLDRAAIAGSMSANGLAPRDSWALAYKPRVPDELHNAEAAAALGRSLAKAHKSLKLEFRHPAEQSARVAKAIEQWSSAARAAGFDLRIEPRPSSSRELAEAIERRDFDLALVHEDAGDSPARLAALFDRRGEALAAGGSNFLGVRDDVLGGQIGLLPLRRQFPLLREQMHNIHVHLVQTMPMIPLWRDEAVYSLVNFRCARFDPLRPFGDMSAWGK